MAKKQHDHVDHPLERLMFFSDAVFAIAITLLVIEIKVPHLHSISASEGWNALAELWPSFFAYVLSFAVIGRFWIAHHAILGVMSRHVPGIMLTNMITLLFVAFMPFATAFYAENLFNFAAAQFYNIVLLGLAISSARLSWIATAKENTGSFLSAEERETMRGRGIGVIIATLLTLVVSFFVGQGMSQMTLALMPIVQRLTIRYRLKKLAKLEAKVQEVAATG